MDTPGVDHAEAEIARAKRAAAFLEDEGVFCTAWRELDARLTNEWRNSPARDTDGRERLWHMLAAMRALETVLRGYVDSGTVVLATLRDIERAKAAHETTFPA